MHTSFPDLDAAICAIQGESDLNALFPALNNWRLAAILALASDVRPVVRAIASLSSRLTALLHESMIDDPAFRGALSKIIKMPKGWNALQSLAIVAPAGWGAAYADALIDAVRNDMCDADSAAALIGASDAAAALLTRTDSIAFAIRRWGQSSPDAPTAWMHALSDRERDRLITALRRYSYAAASCLPWLPSDIPHQMRIEDNAPAEALRAFAEASPTARILHADLLQRLIARTTPDHLAMLTRLACAMGTEIVWQRVQKLILRSPIAARNVVIAASWRDLPEEVRGVIVELNHIIGAARGRYDLMTQQASKPIAETLFAALDPRVWDALDAETQRRWLQALDRETHLAVRSLGLRPEVLAHAVVRNDLVRAAQRHVRDDVALRNALFPVALRHITPNRAHAAITALPMMPPDPGVAFSIASGRGDADVIAPANAALHAPADLALAILLQRSRDLGDSVIARCTALQQALHGRAWNDVQPIMSLLDTTRARILDGDSQVERLAHPDRKEEMRQALSRLTSLPPEVAIPTLVALNWQDPRATSDVAEVIADALRGHGDVFLALTDALGNVRLRTALLPLPKRALLADALRDLALDDPPSAQHLARDVQKRWWRNAIYALLAAPPQHADRIWRALHPSTRESIRKTLALAAPKEGPIADVIHAVARRDLLAALALEAVIQSNNADLRNAGCATLSLRPDILRTMWTQLPQDVQQVLRAHPSTAVVISDMSAETTAPYARRRRFH